MKPLVSIVMPIYNAENHLMKAIESVLKQTYQNWELLLINDCSSDQSLKIIKTYEKFDDRIKCINNGENKGAALSRNIALKKSVGEYIAFLDSDDVWFEDKIEKQLEFMIGNDILMCHGDYNFIDEKDFVLKTIITDKEINYKKLLRENQIKTSFLIIKKEICQKIKFHNIKHEDFAFFLELLKKNSISSVKNEYLCGSYRILSTSLSANKVKSAIWTWSIYRKHLKLNHLTSTYYFFCYIIRCIKKYKR